MMKLVKKMGLLLRPWPDENQDNKTWNRTSRGHESVTMMSAGPAVSMLQAAGPLEDSQVFAVTGGASSVVRWP